MVTERKSAMAAKKKNVSARRFTSENKLDINRFNELAINGVKSRLEKLKELQDRTKRFAVATVQFCSRLPQTGAARVSEGQLHTPSGGIPATEQADMRCGRALA